MKQTTTSRLTAEMSSPAQVQNFLRRPKVCEITGLKTSTLYEKIADGTFPKPIPISKRLVVWLESEVADWQAERVAEHRK